MMKQRKINSLDGLNDELFRLEERKEKLEIQLNGNWDRLQKYYPLMIRNSVFQTANEWGKKGIMGNIIFIPKVQESIGKLADWVADEAQTLMSKWLGKKNEEGI